jgi:hypothetical protein
MLLRLGWTHLGKLAVSDLRVGMHGEDVPGWFDRPRDGKHSIRLVAEREGYVVRNTVGLRWRPERVVINALVERGMLQRVPVAPGRHQRGAGY